MATREELKSYFETDDIPTQEQFWELIDSMAIVGEDNSGSVSAIIGQSWNNTQKALARANIGFDDALDDWIVTWDSIEAGAIPVSRLPAQVVRNDLSYSNPAWITALAASKITGTLAKSQQHAQTPYKDEANTWAETQLFQKPITVQDGAGQNVFDVVTNQIRFRTGNAGYLLGPNGQCLVGEDVGGFYFAGGFTTPTKAIYFGQSNISQIIANAQTINNWTAAFNVRGVDGTGWGPITAGVITAGQVNANNVGANIRLKADGSDSLDGGVLANGLGTIYLTNWNADRGIRINADGSIATIGSGATTFNGAVIGESYRATNGYFVSQESGVDKWMSYSVSGTFYLRDAVNSRSHAIYFSGVNAAAALTQFSSRLQVDEGVTVTKASEGAIALAAGGTGNTGYLAFFKPNSTRQGFIGFDSGNDISFTNEQSGIFAFNKGATFNGAVAVNNYAKINGAAGGASTYLQLLNNGSAIAILGSDTSISGGNAADVGLFVYGDNELCLWVNSNRMVRVTDSGSTFNGTATFNGNLQANGSENFIGGITNIGSTDIYRVGRFRTATGGDIDFGLLGGSTIGMQSLDSGGNFQTLRLQPNGGALSVGGAATFNGNVTVNADNITLLPTGHGGLRLSDGGALNTGWVGFYKPDNTTRQGYIGSDSGNDISFTNEQSGIFAFNKGATFNGNVTALGTGNHQFGIGTAYSTIANGAITNYIGNGGRFSLAEQWWIHKNDADANMYVRDMVNARMQMTFTPGASAAAAVTQIHSQVVVEGAATFSSSFGFSNARFEQPSTASTALKTYETSLATWQEPWRGQASASGATIGFLGATPLVRQTLPAAATDAATTQTLANALRTALIDFGLAN